MGKVFDEAMWSALRNRDTAELATNFLHRLAHAAELLEAFRRERQAPGRVPLSNRKMEVALPAAEFFAVCQWHEFESETLPTLDDLVNLIPEVTELARTAPTLLDRWPYIHLLWHLRDHGAREIVRTELIEDLDVAGEPVEAR